MNLKYYQMYGIKFYLMINLNVMNQKKNILKIFNNNNKFLIIYISKKRRKKMKCPNKLMKIKKFWWRQKKSWIRCVPTDFLIFIGFMMIINQQNKLK